MRWDDQRTPATSDIPPNPPRRVAFLPTEQGGEKMRDDLAVVRGWWCPKEQVRMRNLVDAQDEIQREYGRIAAVTVDEPYVNGAFRAGIGAGVPVLSDEERKIADELDLLELTDHKHRPYLPLTFLLDSN